MNNSQTQNVKTTRISKASSVRAVIFDLDGVIVDTAHYHFLAWRRLARELGIELTEADNEQLKGVSRRESLEIILNMGKVVRTEHEKELLANKKNTWFIDYVERMLPDEIFPGVKALFKLLKENGLKIGLASSSKNAKTVISLLHIQHEFDVVVDGTMVKHSKPDPEIFLLAAERLAVDPQYCVVLEDAEAGVEAALRAGMRCIGIGSGQQLSKAHKVIAVTSDFKLEMLEQLN